MSTSVKIPFWPACLDNVKWSQDNLIAVAGSAQVAILIPQNKVKSAEDARWDHVVLIVNYFSKAEIPPIKSLSFKTWSLAEETSLRYVLSMGWSLPGLGCFRSCVLAILHSDFNMDIWTYTNRPDTKDNWRRCLMVSTAIRHHYDTIYPHGSDASKEDLERRQIRQRIRSFAWAPEVTSQAYCGSSGLALTCQLLAVSTEAGDILVVGIDSPYNALNSETQQWQAAVIHRITVSGYLCELDLATERSRSGTRSFQLIENLVWTTTSDGQEVLAWISGSKLHAVKFRLLDRATSDAMDLESQHEFQQLTADEIRVEGPLSLSPDSSLLLCCTTDAIVTCTTPWSTDTHSSTVPPSLHPFDRGWSEVSGLAITRSQSDLEVLPASFLAYEGLGNASIELSSMTSTTDNTRLSTQLALNGAIRAYNTKHELAADAHTRTWGIAVAPTSIDVAICSTMAPADSPAHVIQSDQYCQVFVCEHAAHISQLSTSSTHTSIESLYHGLQNRIAKEDPSTTRAGIEDILASRLANDNLDTTFASSSAIYQLRALLAHKLRRIDQQQRLAAHILTEKYLSVLPSEWYLEMIHTVLELSKTTPMGQLSRKILAMYKTVQQSLSDGDEHALPVENCAICHESMTFEALKWARCTAGHRFARCSLTFLAIPQPGISKMCGICGAQCLNEHRLTEMSRANLADGQGYLFSQAGDANQDTIQAATPAEEPDNSLARLLFTVFDRCLLCGGQYTANS